MTVYMDHGAAYLDYGATTPMDPRVAKATVPYFSKKFGNPASMHSFGREASKALDASRLVIAKALKASPEEIFFTGSASESNNTVLKGVAFANKNKGNHIIVSSVEHDCVMNSARWLETQGFKVTYLPVDQYGRVSAEKVKQAIRPETILISIMHGNNEVGTINDISAIGRVCREAGVLFHTDAAQTFGRIPLSVANVDFLTASAHKMYGPRGVALLYARKGVRFTPLIHGGGQESGKRSSTVNVAGVVGFAKAVEIAMAEMTKEGNRQRKLRDKLIEQILAKVPKSYLNGHPKERLPNNVNIRFDHIEGEGILMKLDLAGIAASTGSACSSPKLEPSHVLLACGLNHGQAHGSLRLTLGRFTKSGDVEKVIRVLPKIVKELRDMSPFAEESG